jgi:hypothetical protein
MRHAQESALRVQVRHDDARADLVAVLEHHADRLAVLDQHLLYPGVGSKFAAVFLEGSRKGVRDCTHAAARQAPGADAAVDIAHNVMQQDVRGPGRVDAKRRADNTRAGHPRLDQVILEIVLEKIGRAHREEAHVFVEFPFAQRPELFRQPQEFHDVARPERRRVRRRAHQCLADELSVPGQVRLEPVHRVGVTG